MDQTSSDIYPVEIKDKRVLIIGSGIDLNGRRLAAEIDSDKWDVVIRLNKAYGLPQDVGTRIDIIFTRWLQWTSPTQGFFTAEELNRAKQIIVSNQSYGFSQTEMMMLCEEIGHQHVSCGVQAIAYCLNRSAKSIDLIGYGVWPDGTRTQQKRYCANAKCFPNGMYDTNDIYDWEKERSWIENQPECRFI